MTKSKEEQYALLIQTTEKALNKVGELQARLLREGASLARQKGVSETRISSMSASLLTSMGSVGQAKADMESFHSACETAGKSLDMDVVAFGPGDKDEG